MKNPLLACLALGARLAQAQSLQSVVCPISGQSGQLGAKDRDEYRNLACIEPGYMRFSQP